MSTTGEAAVYEWRTVTPNYAELLRNGERIGYCVREPREWLWACWQGTVSEFDESKDGPDARAACLKAAKELYGDE